MSCGTLKNKSNTNHSLVVLDVDDDLDQRRVVGGLGGGVDGGGLDDGGDHGGGGNGGGSGSDLGHGESHGSGSLDRKNFLGSGFKGQV